MSNYKFLVYLTLTVTVERYIAVCHPLRARSWCTCKRGRLAVVIIGLGSLCYNLPRFFEIERCIYVDSELGESWFMVGLIKSRDKTTANNTKACVISISCLAHSVKFTH